MSGKKNKILLTGYRATGKTTIGKEVARRLDFAFLDTDR
ncbi:MAG: shikimate kinase [Thermodesulfobacteriota bacterium]